VQVKEVQDVNIETAMQLYELEHFELVSAIVYHQQTCATNPIDHGLPCATRQNLLQLWERRLDTKALIAWNQKTVVLSFRGTATFSNVLADLSVSRICNVPGLQGRVGNSSQLAHSVRPLVKHANGAAAAEVHMFASACRRGMLRTRQNEAYRSLVARMCTRHVSVARRPLLPSAP
jgi:hypothetical protein